MKKTCTFKLSSVEHLLQYNDVRGDQTFSCQLTPEECLDFTNNIEELVSKISLNIEADNIVISPADMWINHYRKGDHNEIHRHDGFEWMAKCNYIGIIILNTGPDEHLILFDDAGMHSNNVILNTGDCFILENTILHGLDTVKESVTALMFPVKINAQ